jgi:hypothetical protein
VPAVARRIAPALLAVAIAFAAIGCGDDDEDSASTTTSSELTKAQFIREANRICKQQDAKIERASQQFFADAPNDKEPPASEVAQFGKKTVFPAIQDEIDRIRALGAPEGDEDEVQKMLEAAESGLSKLEAEPDQLERGAIASSFEEFQKLASAYGLDECAAG